MTAKSRGMIEDCVDENFAQNDSKSFGMNSERGFGTTDESLGMTVN